MSDITQPRKALVTQILEGDGQASPSQRRAAFHNRGLYAPLSSLVDKVARHAWQISDEDIDTVKASGLTEDQIFEIVVCAAVGQASRQYDAALAALEAAAGRE
jgi:alkylhydroperoxidase family enzyme